MSASTTTVALITVGGTLGGAALTLFGTLLAQYVTGRREDVRRKQERDLKRLELEHQRKESRREERLGAYRRFYDTILTTLYYIGPNKIGDLDPEKRMVLYQDLSSANSELELVAEPDVKDAANALFKALESSAEIRHEREDAFVAAVRNDVRENLGASTIDVTDNSD